MRHVFVPACLGLLTWGTAVGPELSLAKLPDAGVIEHSAALSDGGIAAPMTGDESDSVTLPLPAATARSEADDAALKVSTGYSDQYEIPDPVAEPVPATLRPLKPIVKPIISRSREEVCDTLTQAAHSNNLPAPFFIRLLYQESGFRPGIISSAGAEGVAQFMPETAATRGLDNPFDPVQAIAASASLLRDLAHRFGNLGLAAAAYNAGPKRVVDWLSRKVKLPQETQDYVRNITGRPAEGWKAAEAGSPAIKVPRHAPCQEAAGLLAWDGPDRIPLPTPDARKAPPPLHGNDMLIARAHAKDHKHGNRGVSVADADAVKPAGKDKEVSAEAGASGRGKERVAAHADIAVRVAHREARATTVIDTKAPRAEKAAAKSASTRGEKPKHRHLQLSER